jgi:peptide-methionine (R)-S-oxide reductase
MNARNVSPLLLSFLALAIFLGGCVDKRKSVIQDGASTQDQNVPDVPTAVAPANSNSDSETEDIKLVSVAKDEKLIPLAELPKTKAGWQKRLSAEAYDVTREKGTEPRGDNKYNKHYEDGVYRCLCCGQRLFDSATKYNSHSGWPAFWKPYNEEVILEENDDSFFSRRTEVLCKRCGAHLGHVFNDGPEEKTGLRYCINSVAMEFQARENIAIKTPKEKK